MWNYADIAKLPPPRGQQCEACPFCSAALRDVYRHYEHANRADRDDSGVDICLTCGWWKASRLVEMEYPAEFIWYRYAAHGSLRELDLTDQSVPLGEVRTYLTARYEARFSLHPRTFEETVGSVFRDLGWSVVVTGYSKDHGIDVILEKNDKQVGVQVKRYRNSIKVEQIRSLAGALVLGGMTEGIFVTTSSFQKGVSRTAERFADRGCQIELVDAQRFYDALQLAQLTTDPRSEDFDWESRLSAMVRIDGGSNFCE